jgi:hypothetical protein
MTQVRAGDAFMASGQYREAALQFEAAYAIDPDLAILERLAEAYRMSGDVARANAIYARIAAQRGQVPPPPPYQAAPPQYYVPPSPLPPTGPFYTYRRAPRPPGQQLINAGVGLLIGGYASAILGGAFTIGGTYYGGGDRSWYGAGGMLFIPIAGPFATMAYHTEFYWAVPWAVISGGLQLSGLALLIAGAAVRGSHHPAPRASLPFTLTPYTNAQGGGLTLRMTF